MPRMSLLCGLVVTTLAGCAPIGNSSSERDIGQIHLRLDSMMPVIIAPDTVGRAVSFAVVVNTFGSSSCTTPDGVALVITPQLARITPYDRIQTQGACTADYASRPHPVTVRFTDPGAATLRVIGRVGTALDSVDRVVVVTP